jgi:hypothetical protein
MGDGLREKRLYLPSLKYCDESCMSLHTLGIPKWREIL